MTSPRGLWFSLIAPVVAFGVEGAVGWWAGDWMCRSTSFAAGRALIAIVTVLMLAIAVSGLMTAIGHVQTANRQGIAGDRVEFMALGGVFVSTAFAVGLVWFGLNAAFVRQCGGMR